uniref:Thaumatin-like protein n=1 Tax=Ananas comosus var. bracteatus TaxID=296719 RepID=A0A6V7PAQ8_ANACO|nr:unnamed protein product [Ananas comosus var. bracteatus]
MDDRILQFKDRVLPTPHLKKGEEEQDQQQVRGKNRKEGRKEGRQISLYNNNVGGADSSDNAAGGEESGDVVDDGDGGVVLSGGVGEGRRWRCTTSAGRRCGRGYSRGRGRRWWREAGCACSRGRPRRCACRPLVGSGLGPPGLRLRPRHRPGRLRHRRLRRLPLLRRPRRLPPATLAEITLAQTPQSQDFYDVSLVDGYNIPMSMTPFRGTGGRCASAGCVSDLNEVCPAGLAVRGGADNRVVACKSACSAFGAPQYCCTGSYGSPQQCKPTAYSRLFKTACPKAYSYAYDDPTSIQTCGAGASYIVTFCPHYR